MKKLFKLGTVLGVTTTLMACANETSDEAGEFDTSNTIHLVTREVGSGTRSAFAEMIGLYEGETDQISPAATAQQGTNAVNSTVADDPYAIGYTSVGALNDSLKAVQIDGVEPTEENILAGEYEIARNFNLIIGEDLDEVSEDFWSYMFSAEGQAIVEEAGYIPADTEAAAYGGADLELSGSIDVNGSTSVYPVVEAAAEAYEEIHPDVQIAVHSTGSSSGVTSAIDGTTDIGMASRDLTEEELNQVTEVQAVALDGIAVVVHPNNPLETLAVDEVANIFSGDVSTWSEVID